MAKSKGLQNATDLVKKTGVGFSTARLIWENPGYVPTQRIQDQIANALSVTADDLTVWVIDDGPESIAPEQSDDT